MEKAVVNSMPVKPKEPILKKIVRTFKKERQLWLLCIPMIILVIVFCYVPMYGNIIAFMKYIPGQPILGSKWVGLKYFKEFFQSPDIKLVFRNTFAISGLGILFGFPAPIIFALLLNELNNKYLKKFTQTISYLPYFISWVVAASIIFSLLGNEGLINDILMKTGVIKSSINFMGTGKYFWTILTSANIWKDIGFSSIIYLSAIAGIDDELYQAGAVDGLGRFGMIWHITLPGIATTIILLWILGIGGILSAGFEQQLLIGNSQTQDYWEVIDTYVYKYGIQNGRYSFGAAVGLMRSALSLILVFVTNHISKKALDLSIM